MKSLMFETLLALSAILLANVGAPAALGQAAQSQPSRSAFTTHTYSVPAHPAAGGAAAAQADASCPASVVVGIFDPPASWADYSRRKVLLTNVTIKNGADGARVSCEYGSNNALDRFVAGRACERLGSNGPHIMCRAIPTKK